MRDAAADQARETNTGHFIIALDVARFLPLDLFKAEIDRHVRDLASSRRLPGFDEIRIPGQGRAARRRDRSENGVPISKTVLKQLEQVAASLAIAPLTERAEPRIANSE
jgi:LDH2 family malate/lactate/ureidoglycolate dehydrogenase